jgi:hypothetical protein
MAVKIVQLSGETPDPTLLAEAAAIIRRGGLVAFPTETVYGLAADATNPQAIERLNQVKGRPPEKPYSVENLPRPRVAKAQIKLLQPPNLEGKLVSLAALETIVMGMSREQGLRLWVSTLIICTVCKVHPLALP